MKIDPDRIRAILKAEHSYYGGRDSIRRDERWTPKWEHLIAPQLSPAMRVLHVGCGMGHFLLELSPDGLLYCEEIAERHQKEVVEIFGDSSRSEEAVPEVDEVKALMEENGFDVCLAADVFTKWIYPDVYAWVEYVSNLWTWLGRPLPEADDPRIALFAERNTIATGEIETTHHVAWVAAVKR